MYRFLSVVAIAALIIAGCSSDDDAADTTTTTEATTATTTAPPETTQPPETTEPAQPPETTEAPETVEPDNTDVPVDLSSGISHSCMLRRSGKVSCWGDNSKGQLGNGEFGRDLHFPAPVEVDGITDAIAIGAGWEHTCAVHTSGEMSCWGDDTSGELGNGEIADLSAVPVKVVGIDDAIAATAGHWHTCALRLTGEVSCWGRNHDGQLGNGEMSDYGSPSTVPVAVMDISDATDVAAGGEHTCAVHASGEVSCWGNNGRGQLGNGTEVDAATPVKVPGIEDAVSVAATTATTCVQRESGGVSCWGDNTLGQLGGGMNLAFTIPLGFSPTPIDVLTIDDSTDITAGQGFACAARLSGKVSCWGNNYSKQLGAPTEQEFTPTPVEVSELDDAIVVSAGVTHVCALRETSSVACWGSNFQGQLGNTLGGGISTERVKVVGITDAIDVAASGDHTCATHATGEVSCWGRRWKGQVGDEASANTAPLPVKVTEVTSAQDVSASIGINCATLDDGHASCWGAYVLSEMTTLDNGDISPVPRRWNDAGDTARIVTGGGHACALKTSGKITCGGANWYGNLGTGEFGTTISWAPQEVINIDDATDLSLGFAHTCALHATGEISCWGRNEFGQLGTGEENRTINVPAPVKVLNIDDATAVAVGEAAVSCALHESGEISCWGLNPNFFGTGADPASDHSAVPVKIEGITDAVKVSVGPLHICALHPSGEISCWGADYFGQLGTTEHINDGYSISPVRVPGIDDAKDISVGFNHTCALHESGEITCWGWNGSGQLGNGQAFTDTSSYTPVTVVGT